MVLVCALSVDLFVATFAYGAGKIKIPFIPGLVISVVCTLMLFFSLVFGRVITPYIPEFLTGLICRGILIILGLIRIFDSAVKSYIKKHARVYKRVRFSLFSLNFILNVYANPEEADLDKSKSLSAYEAVYLAFILSLDGMAAGFGAGLTGISIPYVVAASLIISELTVFLGFYLGNKIAEKTSKNFSWVSGVLLMLLAVFK